LVLIFVNLPLTMRTLQYVLLYIQMISLFIQSRITTTHGAQNIKKQEKVVRILKITLMTFVTVFIISQFVFMLLVYVDPTRSMWFQTQALLVVTLLIITLNVS
jgi:hypothetical protein